jgi:hypothetical protein
VSFHDVAISAELSARIKRTAGELGVPVKTVLLAAHVQVVSALTGEPDVLTVTSTVAPYRIAMASGCSACSSTRYRCA